MGHSTGMYVGLVITYRFRCMDSANLYKVHAAFDSQYLIISKETGKLYLCGLASLNFWSLFLT